MDNTTNNYKPVTVGNWMLTYLLMFIPIVNIIMAFIWAFGGNTEISKANWAKATLIWMLISIGLGIVVVVLWIIVLAGIIGSTLAPSS